MTDKPKNVTWERFGYDEAIAGLSSDPPYQPGNKAHDDYVSGYESGELFLERQAAKPTLVDRITETIEQEGAEDRPDSDLIEWLSDLRKLAKAGADIPADTLAAFEQIEAV